MLITTITRRIQFQIYNLDILVDYSIIRDDYITMRCLLFLFILPFSLQSQEIIDSTVVIHKKLVYFESNAFNISQEDQNQILELVDHIAKFPNYSFLIAAHTDDVGSAEANLILSEKRKQSVVDVLVENGVALENIKSSYHGEALPTDLSKDEEGRQKNRRVVVQLRIPKRLLRINGVVKDDSTGVGIIAEVDLLSKDYNTTVKSDKEGHYSMWAPIDEFVVLEINAKDYFFESKRIKVSRVLIEKLVELPLVKAELGRKFTLEEMFFHGNSPKLLPKSMPVITRLKKFMIVNNDICIELAGHVNHPNSPRSVPGSFHNYLASARAITVQELMVEEHIHPDRMLSRGYGNWFMVYPKAKTEDKAKQNRRVEVVISSCDSTRLLLDDKKPSREDLRPPNNNLAAPRRKAYDRYYSEETVGKDTESFSERAKRDLNLQIDKMKKAGLDPKEYTYKEILSALPGLPIEK